MMDARRRQRPSKNELRARHAAHRRRRARLTWLAAGIGLSVACSEPVFPPIDARVVPTDSFPDLPREPPVVRSGDFVLSGDAGIGGGEPPWITAVLRVRNATAEARALGDLCFVGVDLERVGAAGPRSAWAERVDPGAGCSPEGATEIEPGAGRSLRFAGGEPFIRAITSVLGDSLAEGEYSVTAHVRSGGQVLAVPLGTVSLHHARGAPLTDRRLLRYAVRTSVEGAAPRRVVTRVAVINPTTRHFRFSYGACVLSMQMFTHVARAGQPQWRTDPHRDCALYLAEALIPPGGAISPHELTEWAPVHELLGDSLPARRYHFSAQLVGEDPFPTGSLDLDPTPTLLPAERTVDGLLYRVQTMPGEAGEGALRVTLWLANTSASGVAILAGSNCETRIDAFRDRSSRDLAYRGTRPDWAYRGCPLSIGPTWLEPGEVRRIDADVPGDPAYREGRSYLMLSVHVRREPGGRDVLLFSAGEAVIGGG